MNDRFKFRVWDKNNKVYFGGDYGVSYYLTDSEIDGDLYCRQCDGPFELSEDDDFIVEQCTGLKDKDGNLIYEGDIIKGSNGSINGQEWEFTHVVKWNDKLHRIVLPDFESDEDWSHYYNVIGNIHENKELLDER